MNDYIFVADAYGLTSLILLDEKLFKVITIYCDSNSQRVCVWGIVNLEDGVAKGLDDLISSGRNDTALELIKQSPYSLPKNKVKKYSRLLKKIPDPELDLA